MKSSENEDEDAEFPSKLKFSSNGTLIAMEFAAHFVDSQPPVTEINKTFYPDKDFACASMISKFFGDFFST